MQHRVNCGSLCIQLIFSLLFGWLPWSNWEIRICRQKERKALGRCQMQGCSSCQFVMASCRRLLVFTHSCKSCSLFVKLVIGKDFGKEKRNHRGYSHQSASTWPTMHFFTVPCVCRRQVTGPFSGELPNSATFCSTFANINTSNLQKIAMAFAATGDFCPWSIGSIVGKRQSLLCTILRPHFRHLLTGVKSTKPNLPHGWSLKD